MGKLRGGKVTYKKVKEYCVWEGEMIEKMWIHKLYKEL